MADSRRELLMKNIVTALEGIALHTNLLLWSEELDRLPWTYQQLSVVADAVLAPDDRMTADKLVSDITVGGSRFLRHSVSVVTGISQYTYSISLKAAEITTVSMDMYLFGLGGDYIFANYDLIAGTALIDAGETFATGPYAVGIEDEGNGWFRCWISFQSLQAGDVYADVIFPFGIGDGTSGIYAWGAQLEEGSSPSDYFKTTSAAASLYNNTILSVQRPMQDGNTYAIWPMIMIGEGEDQITEEENPQMWHEMTVFVLIQTRAASSETRSANEILNSLSRDVHVAMMADRGRGGYAVDSTPLAEMPFHVEEGQPELARLLLYKIQYRHNASDPNNA